LGLRTLPGGPWRVKPRRLVFADEPAEAARLVS
jgi:hypothetical protein